MRLGRGFIAAAGGRQPDGVAELGHRARQVAHQEQRRAQLVPQRPAEHRAAIGQLHALAEEIGGGLEVARFQRPHAAQLERQTALQRQVQLRAHRIGDRHLGVLPLAQMRGRARGVAKAPIRHRQRRVHAGRGRLRAQRLFQHGDGARMVLARQRRLSQAQQHRHALRRVLPGALEQRLGLVGLALIQIEAPQPDQRRHVVGRELEHAGQVRHGLVRLAAALVQVMQQVRPAWLVRVPDPVR